MNTVILNRAQMSQRHKVPVPLDVTVKSGNGLMRKLAPTWNMVMGHKAGTMSDATYTELYNQILEDVPDYDMQAIVDLIREHDQVTFLCYCVSGTFCHTYLLIDWLCLNWSDLFINGTGRQQ